jgi:hypothetical protein
MLIPISEILVGALLYLNPVAHQDSTFEQCKSVLQDSIMIQSKWAMAQQPVTVTADYCKRSAGGRHDFYSEGDYWWPNPADSNGAYIQRDGFTNPDNFTAHRKAMIQFSKTVGLLASAFILTHNDKYATHALAHYKAWFTDTATRMNPSLLYAQAIKGKATGRGIGIIDMIQMMEVVKSMEVFEKAGKIPAPDLKGMKNWFSDYLSWINTHQYGIDEREAKNNHGTCWVMQVAVFSAFVQDRKMMEYCSERFKTVLLPNQLDKTGSFPLELKRTKPFGYSLFNLDAMTTIAQELSTPQSDLWNMALPDGQSLKTAVLFMVPFVENKNTWAYKPDVMYWSEWPVAHPFLLFASQKFQSQRWLYDWKGLKHFPETEEVVRNMPVRNPLIWLK